MAHSVTATAPLLCLLVIAVGASVPIPRVNALNEGTSTQDIVSNWSGYPVTFDGKITYDEEWPTAARQKVVLFRGWVPEEPHMIANDNITTTVYVKNDAKWLYLLVNVNSTNRNPVRAGVEYYWWTFHGVWDGARIAGVERNNSTYDAYYVNETYFQNVKPTNVRGAASCVQHVLGSDCWFEFAKMLRSDDAHDWSLAPGEVVGGRPLDFLVRVFFQNEASYIRYATLHLASGDFPRFFGQAGQIESFEMPSHSWVYALAFDSDGSRMAIGLRNPAELRLYYRSGSLMWTKSLDRGWAVYSIAFSADGRFIVFGTDYSLEFYSVNGTRLWWKVLRAPYSVAISADGSRVAFATYYGSIGVVDEMGNYVWASKPAGGNGGISISPDGDYVAAVVESKSYPISEGARLLLYDRKGTLLWSQVLDKFNADTCYCNVLQNYAAGGKIGARYSAPSISKGASAIAVVGADGKVRLFDRDGGLVWTREAGNNLLAKFGDVSVAMPSDARYVAVAISEQGMAKIHLYAADGTDWGSVTIYPDATYLLAINVSPDGSYVGGSPNVFPAPDVSRFNLLALPDAENAVSFLLRAVELGNELGLTTNEAEIQLQIAREQLNGSLTSAYDTAFRAYTAIQPELKSRLLYSLNETSRQLQDARLQLQSIDKSAARDVWANVSSRLERDSKSLVSAEIDIKAGTLASYEKAFRSLEAVKQSLLQDQSLLSQYSANQSSTAAQLIGLPFSFIYIGVVLGFAATALILVFVGWRIRSAKSRLKQSGRL